MDVLGVLHEVAGVPGDHQRRAGAGLRRDVVEPLPRRRGAEEGRAAVVVHVVGAEFGVQRVEHVAQRHAPLPAVARVAVAGAADQGALAVLVDVEGGAGQRGVDRLAGREIVGQHAEIVGAAVGGHVRLGEEGAAVVDDGLVPLDLVEGLGGQVVGQALRQVEHVHRDQAFLDLGAGTAERGNVDRVDRVDAVLDEGALAPAHHLLAQAHAAGHPADVVVVVDEGVEQLRAGGFRAFLAAAVVDVLEQAALVLQLEVVPVLAAQEYTGVLVFQFEVMDALEDLREGLALLEIQVAIVGGLRQPPAAIVDPDQIRVGIGGRPTGTDGQAAVELSVDLPDAERGGVGLARQAGGDRHGQCLELESGALSYCAHAAFPCWVCVGRES
ncbi:hypothetical protein D9M71_318980 [compost metagenome]